MKNSIVKIIFGSKWLLLPFYFGLIIAQIFYSIKFCEMVFDLCKDFQHLTESQLMLVVLSLIDITMVANLIKMIVTGSYQTFIEHVSTDSSEKVSSGLLKVKMGSSLIGVSSIHLLQVFINPIGITDRELIVKAGIHIIFLISTIGLAWIDYLHGKTENHIH